MQQVRKILLKNSEPLGKKLKKTSGIFDSAVFYQTHREGEVKWPISERKLI